MVDDLFGGMGPAAEPPKPTPGPWRVYECPDTGRLWIETADEERLVIADIPGDGETIEGEEYANARILAAAPSLLAAAEAWEALEAHVENCEDCTDGAFPELCEEGFPFADDLRLKMRAALAKARSNDPAA